MNVQMCVLLWGDHRDQNRVLAPLELELQINVSYYTGSRNQIQGLWKLSLVSLTAESSLQPNFVSLLSLLFFPCMMIETLFIFDLFKQPFDWARGDTVSFVIVEFIDLCAYV